MSTAESDADSQRGRREAGIPAVVPDTLFPDVEREQRWRGRVRGARSWVPRSARDAPLRSVYRSTMSGKSEIYCWDRHRDAHRQLTDRPSGTTDAVLAADGHEVWWFADNGGDEFGHWVRQPFAEDAAPTEAVAGLEDGYNSGIALGRTVSVIGLAGDAGTAVHAIRPGSRTVIYQSPEDALVKGLSADESMAVIHHAEQGDPSNPGIRVVRTDTGETVGERHDTGRSLTPLGFSTDPETASVLLVGHERRGSTELMLWDVVAGAETELPITVAGDLTGCWCGEGRAIAITSLHHGRSTLHRLDLATGQVEHLPTPPGRIADLRARPDGSLEYEWSSGQSPWTVRTRRPDGEDQPVLSAPEDTAASVPVRDVWVDGPGGPIHTWIARPSDAAGPLPTVVRLHGGPHSADYDDYNAMRAAWVDAGFAVVQPNFRGSTGYGSQWRNAITGRPGLTELEDITAVARWVVHQGIADPTSLIIEGYSWGGYLALLAAGTQPGVWAAHIAGFPVADYVAAYDEEMEPLKALDRGLFGGSPAEVPETYRVASPITYVEDVTGPVLILAGRNDPRCPIGQIENYVQACTDRGAPPWILRYDSGHGSQVSDMIETFIRTTIAFAREHSTTTHR